MYVQSVQKREDSMQEDAEKQARYGFATTNKWNTLLIHSANPVI